MKFMKRKLIYLYSKSFVILRSQFHLSTTQIQSHQKKTMQTDVFGLRIGIKGIKLIYCLLIPAHYFSVATVIDY